MDGVCHVWRYAADSTLLLASVSLVTLHRLGSACKPCDSIHTGVGWGTETLQQLVLVLSDGRLSEKATLRRAVREAAERAGVMLAFIILDNREPGNSVLDTKSVRSVMLPGGHGKTPKRHLVRSELARRSS